jgi:hypothetical protein
MKQTLEDYGLKFDHIPIKYDNTSAISLSKNPIQHSRTKHIELRHHFLKDHIKHQLEEILALFMLKIFEVLILCIH